MASRLHVKHDSYSAGWETEAPPTGQAEELKCCMQAGPQGEHLGVVLPCRGCLVVRASVCPVNHEFECLPCAKHCAQCWQWQEKIIALVPGQVVGRRRGCWPVVIVLNGIYRESMFTTGTPNVERRRLVSGGDLKEGRALGGVTRRE